MYRRNGDYQSEKILNKQVRSSGKKDRADWLEKYVSSGNWDAVRYLRKPRTVKHAAIQRPDGTLSDTAERADVMADFFERTQWEY